MPRLLQVLLIAMLPVIELRGAIPIGLGMGLPYRQVILTAMLGNLLPVPFIILFIRPIMHFFEQHSRILSRFSALLRNKADRRSQLIDRWGALGLILLVAIPLPGTGAWTGALVAALLEIRMRRAIPAILIGLMIAAAIVTFVSYGVDVLLT